MDILSKLSQVTILQASYDYSTKEKYYKMYYPKVDMLHLPYFLFVNCWEKKNRSNDKNIYIGFSVRQTWISLTALDQIKVH